MWPLRPLWKLCPMRTMQLFVQLLLQLYWHLLLSVLLPLHVVRPLLLAVHNKSSRQAVTWQELFGFFPRAFRTNRST